MPPLTVPHVARPPARGARLMATRGRVAGPMLVFAAITCASAGVYLADDALVGAWWALAGTAGVAATWVLARRTGPSPGVLAAAAAALLCVTLAAGTAGGSSAVADVALGVALVGTAALVRDPLLAAGGVAVAGSAAAIGAGTGEAEHYLVPLCTGVLLAAVGALDARRDAGAAGG